VKRKCSSLANVVVPNMKAAMRRSKDFIVFLFTIQIDYESGVLSNQFR
jgi:hypothetical protein